MFWPQPDSDSTLKWPVHAAHDDEMTFWLCNCFSFLDKRKKTVRVIITIITLASDISTSNDMPRRTSGVRGSMGHWSKDELNRTMDEVKRRSLVDVGFHSLA